MNSGEQLPLQPLEIKPTTSNPGFSTPQRAAGENGSSNTNRNSQVQQQIQLSDQKSSGSDLKTKPTLDSDIMIEKNMQKTSKRMRLEEEKEMRIQEFLAMKRKEYDKYISLDFDYGIVSEELASRAIIDYTQLDEERERIRLNKLRKDPQQEQGGIQETDEQFRQRGNPREDITQILGHIKVYITPLQENFVQMDNSLKIIPANNVDHYLLGPPKFCGSVIKRNNDRNINEEVWVVVRSFFIFVYTDPNAARPIHLLRIPLQKIAQDSIKSYEIRPDGRKDIIESQYFSIIEKMQSSVHFLLGKTSAGDSKTPKNSFYQFLKRQVAIKTYLFLCGFLSVAPDQNLLSFFENDEATLLKINLDTKPIENMILIHQALKPVSEAFFFYTFLTIACSKNLMVIDFSNLGLWSKFLVFFFSLMKDDSVCCPIQILKLDNNDITDEVLSCMSTYLMLPQSFFLKHLSINNADIRDSGCQIIGRMISDRHMRLQSQAEQSNSTLQYQLPFEYLSLNNVKMNDQGLYNIVIHLEKVQRQNQNRGIIDYDQYLELHLAQNNITEKSMSSLGSLLSFFQGINVLDISESKQIICIQKEKFFEQLKNNYSLITLNISKIEMNIDSFRSLLGLLEDNYTLQTVLISLTEMMIKEIAKSKNINLLKYFMISYNPNMIFENI